MCSLTGSEHVRVKTHFQVHEQDVLRRRLCAYDEDLVFNSRKEKKEATAIGVAQSTTEANANLWRSFLRSCLLVR